MWALGKLGDKTNKAEYYEEAVPVRRLMPKSAHTQRELSYCLYRVGYLREQKGELDKALPALREAEAIHRAAKGYEKEHSWCRPGWLHGHTGRDSLRDPRFHEP